jgi:DNA-binding transcriptional regulator LsrR (DeoR family)
MGISTVQLSKYIRKLREVGLVGVHKKPRICGLGVINVYTLVDPIK